MNFTESVMSDIAERLASAVESVTEQIQADLKSLIDEPYPPASEPHTPPHKRSGDYQQSIETEPVTVTPESVHGAVFTDAQLGEWLENGTSRMEARPHFAPTADEWEPKVVEEIKSAM